MDPDSELQFDFPPFLRLYRSGRVERLDGTGFVPADSDPDPATGVVSKDVPVDPDRGVSARLYLPAGAAATAAAAAGKLPIVVYFHGGAFCIESPFSPLYHRYLASLAAAAGVVAVSVHYRLAPEHPLPAAYDDAWAALQWAASNAASGPEPWLAARGDLRRLFLAGDSAGANIAHNMAIRAAAAKEESSSSSSSSSSSPLGFAIRGVVLMNPYFWGKDPVGEETRDAEVRARMESTWGFVCAGRYGIEHPYVDPWVAPRAWRELASERVLVTVSEMDLFRERGKAYAEGLAKSGWGGEAQVYETEGEDHVYYLTNPHSKKALKELQFVASFINRP